MISLEAYIRIFISIGLVVVFYFLFGEEIIVKLKVKDIEITKNEEETSVIPSPGLFNKIIKIFIKMPKLSSSGLNVKRKVKTRP